MTEANNRQLHAIVTGLVQGVSFRYYTQREARALGLTGWVRNRPDGSVEVLAEGSKGQLDQLVEFLNYGPSAAVVERVDVAWNPASNAFHDFEIRASGRD